MTSKDPARLDRIVADARRATEERKQAHRGLAPILHPWICGRSGREFTRANAHELTVRYRNHRRNPPNGGNRVLPCLCRHDNEHRKPLELEAGEGGSGKCGTLATHAPFAEIKALLDGKTGALRMCARPLPSPERA